MMEDVLKKMYNEGQEEKECSQECDNRLLKYFLS